MSKKHFQILTKIISLRSVYNNLLNIARRYLLNSFQAKGQTACGLFHEKQIQLFRQAIQMNLEVCIETH